MISAASLHEGFGAQRPRRDTQLFAADDTWPIEVRRSAASRGRSLKTFVGDVSLIGICWALLIGIVIDPQAQIVGIATCAIALIFARGGKR